VIDVNGDGVVDGNDDGVVEGTLGAGSPEIVAVIDGEIDINNDGVVDGLDDGFVHGQAVTDGQLSATLDGVLADPNATDVNGTSVSLRYAGPDNILGNSDDEIFGQTTSGGDYLFSNLDPGPL